MFQSRTEALPGFGRSEQSNTEPAIWRLQHAGWVLTGKERHIKHTECGELMQPPRDRNSVLPGLAEVSHSSY